MIDSDSLAAGIRIIELGWPEAFTLRCLLLELDPGTRWELLSTLYIPYALN